MNEAPKLNVPFFFQPKDKPYCGPACARMVLAFHGERVALKSIVSSMNMTADGVDMAALGSFFLARGYEATIAMWLRSFPNRFLDLTEGVEEELLRWCHKNIAWHRYALPKINFERYQKSIPRFIAAGGTVIPKPVSCHELKKALEKQRPPILNLNVEALYRLKRHQNAGHYVVPTCIAGKNITIHDPNQYRGGIVTYPLELVLHASYIWTAGALFVKPR